MPKPFVFEANKPYPSLVSTTALGGSIVLHSTTHAHHPRINMGLDRSSIGDGKTIWYKFQSGSCWNKHSMLIHSSKPRIAIESRILHQMPKVIMQRVLRKKQWANSHVRSISGLQANVIKGRYLACDSRFVSLVTLVLSRLCLQFW